MAVLCRGHHTHPMSIDTTKGVIMELFIGILGFAILLLMASTDALMSWFN